MKKIVAILLMLASPLVFAGSATHFELKVYDITDKSLEKVIKVRHGLKPEFNPKLVIEQQGNGALVVKKSNNTLFELEIDNFTEDEYGYNLSAYDQGEKLTDTGEKKLFKKSNKLMFVADVADRKYLVELFVNNLKPDAKLKNNKLRANDIAMEEGACGFVSVMRSTNKRDHYPAIIREINGDLKLGGIGEFQLDSGTHDLLIYAAVPKTLSSRKNRQLGKGALTRFKVMPNKIYYIAAYYNKSELDKAGGHLWQPVVIEVKDKKCEL